MEPVTESRHKERYIALQPFSGSFGSVAICVCDMGDTGVQIEHSDPIRVATKGRLAFSGVGTRIVELRGIVMWSRLSAHPNASGKFLYRTGVKVEDQDVVLASTIQQLLSRGLLRRDDLALERKQDLLMARDRDRARMKIQKVALQVSEGPTNDQLLLIQHARDRLRSHPEEALKWHNRARYSLSADESRTFDENGQGHKEDILAVWEYLERSIELPAVARAFIVK